MTYTQHYSVLKNECLDNMYLGLEESDRESFLFADLTFGGGGHSLEIVKRDKRAHLISFDQDPDALANGRKLIEANGVKDRLHLEDSNFCHFAEVVSRHQDLIDENGGFDAVLMDLGVSSHHFDEGGRGFSFRVDAPLDMRMDYDNDNIKTAKDIVNNYSDRELEQIFRDYGEEKFSRKIARRIVDVRHEKEIETTFELADLIKECYPMKMRFGRIHPATKCFQALRIEVNRELHVLTEVIPQIIPLLRNNGKILVISFHSLEDRIVKQEFKKLEKDGGEYLFETSRKPIIPTDQEIEENSRSRSAKLRILERVTEKKNKNKYAKFSTLK